MVVKHLLKLSFLISALLLIGCARSFNPDVERGSGYDFVPGTPDIRLDAVGFITNEDETFLNVAIQISKNSLIYRSDFESRFAEIDIDIRIVDEKTSLSQNYQETITISDPAEDVISELYYFFNEDYEISPGYHRVEVTVTDKTSEKESVREARTYIFDPENPQTDATSVRLYGKNSSAENNEYTVITTYDIPAANDSILFELLISNKYESKALTVEARMIQYESDREPAMALSDRMPPPGSLKYVGLKHRNPTVIDQSTRIIEQSGSVQMQYYFETLPIGNYRFEVEIDTSGEENGEKIYKARDFSVKSKNYPNIMSAREMAEPLVYIMGRKEHRELLKIENPDSLKKAIDRFWLSHLQPNQAKAVINMYYERVEMANKFFSTFKEGWKTDMGRVYIMFGPPLSVERFHNSMVWAYTYNLSDPLYNIRFNRNRVPTEFFPFEHYLVERNSEYFSLEYQQEQRWLNGIMR